MDELFGTFLALLASAATIWLFISLYNVHGAAAAHEAEEARLMHMGYIAHGRVLNVSQKWYYQLGPRATEHRIDLEVFAPNGTPYRTWVKRYGIPQVVRSYAPGMHVELRVDPSSPGKVALVTPAPNAAAFGFPK